jgi:hypothetical protein
MTAMMLSRSMIALIRAKEFTMKKLFFALIVLFLVMPSMAFAEVGHGVGIFAGATTPVPREFEEVYPIGYTYGFEYGFIWNNAEVWPKLSIEMMFEDGLRTSSTYATLGVDVIIGWFGIQPGFTMIMDQDFTNPIMVEGLAFPENDWGMGPSLEVSARILKLGKSDYLEIRPSLAATYAIMMEGEPEFRLRFQLNAHLKGTW